MNGMIESMAWALVHFLWQGALAGLAAAGVLALLKNGRAVVRYAVATGFLLLMPALPVATAVRLAGSPEADTSSVGSAPIPARAEARPIPTPILTSTDTLPPVLPWVFGLWLAGVASLSVYHLGGWRVTRRLSRQGRAPGASLETLVLGLCRRLGIERAVILLESAAVSVPTVVGWLRPVLLVPASTLAGLSPRQLEAILAHELAHVRRHDYLINLLQAAVETLLFYHPAVWWVSTQVRRERENCCDDLAVAVCGDRLGYARALADLEGLRFATPRLAVAANGGSLSDRIRRLVGAPARRSARQSWAAGLLALALLPAAAAIQLACSHGMPAKQESQVVPTTDLAGHWSGELQGDQLRLEIKMRKGPLSDWASMDSYPVSQLAGFSPGPAAHFELRRDAGTFRLQGSFQNGKGHGDVTFSANPEFERVLGVPVGNSGLMELVVYDVSLDYAREMKDLGLVAYPREKLTGWKGLWGDLVGRREPPVQRLIELKIHGVTPEFARGIQAAGYHEVSPWDLIELRQHDIDPAWVKAVHETLYGPLPPFRLVELHNHNVTPEWLHGIVEAYPRVNVDDVIAMRVRGVDGDSSARPRSAITSR
ncbi:MAG: hypothetical protein QOF89_3094 [Acidobacteriota bacterium]|jgi:beta-lactamase regulating signal transducer with metallopeptidase domain|nr:hypothetical protein [Acidobacteriota bacterium]